MAKRIGPRMAEIQAIVSALPGISKRGALLAAGLPVSGVNRDAPVHRAVAAGLILVERERSNHYRLFATERDRKRWHLWRELLVAGTPAERVAEIAAQIAAWTPSARRAGRTASRARSPGSDN
jgi:hypothetical protein